MAVQAANYKVTVTTQQQIRYEDKDYNTVDTEIAVGNSMTFYVVADTPRQAEDEAMKQCQGACDSGIEVVAAKNVPRKGKSCTKYVKTVPWTVKAELD